MEVRGKETGQRFSGAQYTFSDLFLQYLRKVKY